MTVEAPQAGNVLLSPEQIAARYRVPLPKVLSLEAFSWAGEHAGEEFEHDRSVKFREWEVDVVTEILAERVSPLTKNSCGVVLLMTMDGPGHPWSPLLPKELSESDLYTLTLRPYDATGIAHNLEARFPGRIKIGEKHLMARGMSYWGVMYASRTSQTGIHTGISLVAEIIKLG